MPQAPPGILHREVYSESLFNLGLLFERRYKVHQLSDLSQLQNRAKNYLVRSFATGISTTVKENAVDTDANLDQTTPLTFTEEVDNKDIDALEYEDHDIVDLLKVDEDKDINLNKLGTTVVTLKDVSNSVVEDITPNKLPTNDNKLSEKLSHLQPHVEIRSAGSYKASPSVDNVLVNIHGDHVDSEGDWTLPNNKRLRIVAFFCFLAHIVVSLVFALVLYLHVHLDWQRTVNNLHIVFPFVAYFTTRVVLQGYFDWEFKSLIRPFMSMSTIIGPGVNKARILKGAANNICLILAVATAALPCHVVDDIEPRKTLSHLYYGIFTALLITDIVAVAVHHYLINRHVARLMYKKP